MTRNSLPEVVLAIDIGTSSAKAALIDVGGRIHAHTSLTYEPDRPRPGWVEQDAEHWWNATIELCRRLFATHAGGAASVRSVAVTGQTPSLVLVDDRLKPVVPAIIWSDVRSNAQADWIRENVDPVRWRLWHGMDLPIDASFPPARLRWVREEKPAALERIAHCLQPKDFVIARLTGEAVSDAWSAKGIVNILTGKPDPDYYAAFGLDTRMRPRIGNPWDVAGSVGAGAAEATGISAGTRVLFGWSDALAAIVAVGGLADPTAGFLLSGTSDIVGINADRDIDAAGLLVVPGVLLEGRALVYGPTQASGRSLAWYAGVVDRPVADLIKTVDSAPEGWPLFLPYLEGERAPIWDASVRGAFVGLSSGHTRDQLACAVLEGVAFSDRHVLETARRYADVPINRCYSGGAPMLSGTWASLRSDVLGMPIDVLEHDDASLRGGALLGWIEADAYHGLGDAGRRGRAPVRTYEPDMTRHHAHSERYDAYLQSARGMQELAHTSTLGRG